MGRLILTVLASVLVWAAAHGTNRHLARVPEAGHAAAGAVGPAWNGSAGDVDRSRFRAVGGLRGMVVSDDRIASEWGAKILRLGGNAVDAAVATAFMLSVTRPHFASLGGGGFLLYCPKARPCHVIDFRETAPALATRDLYVRDGKPDTELSKDGALASGVPGVTAGLLLALSRFGTLPRKSLLSSPILLARAGISVTADLEYGLSARWKAMNPEARRIFGCAPSAAAAEEAGDGSPKRLRAPCPVGTVIRQPDLARVLAAISAKGKAGFYQGWVAEKLARAMEQARGLITANDLMEYRAKLREPLIGRYRGLEVVSMPPPSSGGLILLQALGFVERAERAGELRAGYGAVRTIHALVHGLKLAFADRAFYLGDPDQVQMPLARLLSPEYLNERWKSFDPSRATDIAAGNAGKPLPAMTEGSNTTHFSVIDAEGNAVALTTTLNDYLGSGFVPPGTGVMMNNEMDDFSMQPGTPNQFGLVGNEQNAIAPGKRPLSSMAPTILRTDTGEVRQVLGAQGGPRIPTSVFQTIVNRYEFGMSLPDAIGAPRFHQQWRPASLYLEQFGFSPETQSGLEALGYSIESGSRSGKMHAIERFESGRSWGVVDPRADGAAVAE